jgi:hypothetical protein
MPQEFDRVTFEVEHVIPEKHGGLAVLGNLALSCFFCNRYKGPNLSGLDPVTGLLTSLYDPRRDVWSEHFYWDAAVLRGHTPRARATITVLRINDAPRVAHRALSIAVGDFPSKATPGQLGGV